MLTKEPTLGKKLLGLSVARRLLSEGNASVLARVVGTIANSPLTGG